MNDVWHRVPLVDLPDDGRVRSAVVDGHSVALTRCGRTPSCSDAAPTFPDKHPDRQGETHD